MWDGVPISVDSNNLVRYLPKTRNMLISIVWCYNIIPYLTRTPNAKRYHTGDVNDEDLPVCPLSSSRTELPGIASSESVTNGGRANVRARGLVRDIEGSSLQAKYEFTTIFVPLIVQRYKNVLSGTNRGHRKLRMNICYLN